MKFLTGLILGIIFGFLIKRGRICYMGTIRDVYLENKTYNIVLIMATIMTEALVYSGLILAGVANPPSFMCYSAVALTLGSFIFGFGAVMTSGCMTMTLIKSGDGRLMGWISILVFIIVGYFFTGGAGNVLTTKLLNFSQQVDIPIFINDKLRFIFSLIVAILMYVLMFMHGKTARKKKKSSNMAKKSRWRKEPIFILIGAVMGITFPISEYFGRLGGFAITTPILSYAYAVFKPDNIVGG